VITISFVSNNAYPSMYYSIPIVAATELIGLDPLMNV